MAITHLFFDLHGVLIDTARAEPCYIARIGDMLAARYGGDPARWADANRRILADWDSYYTDLDLSGDDGLAAMWEGEYRTTRAHFRIVGAAEPTHNELKTLAHEMRSFMTEGCDALFPDVRPTLEVLRAAGYQLGVATHALTPQAVGSLVGGGVRHQFTAPICTPDLLERFDKDHAFYMLAALRAGVEASACLAIDDRPNPLRGARAAGMHTALVIRDGGTPPRDLVVDHVVRDLRELPILLGGQHPSPPTPLPPPNTEKGERMHAAAALAGAGQRHAPTHPPPRLFKWLLRREG